MKALHFGAGNIGRGLIGYLLNKTGYEVCFVDADHQLVENINQNKQYVIELLDENHTQETVSPVKALHTSAQNEIIEAILEADFITTSVGAQNLSRIAPILSRGLLLRTQQSKPLIDVIANENTINASSQLKEEVKKIVSEQQMDDLISSVGFPNSAIDRLSLSEKRKEGEIALVEPYYEWIINRTEMVNKELPPVKNAVYVDTLKPHIERKLYMVNMGHAATAYMGYLRGYPTIQRALKDAKLEEFLRATLHESARYFTHIHDMDEDGLKAFIEKTIDRFKNENISDDLLRVGRAPIRKLGSEERLVKPTRVLYDLGLPIENLTTAIAAALLFDNPEDEEAVQLQDYIKNQGVEAAIAHFTGWKDDSIVSKIKSHYVQLKQEQSLKS
ncbi:mannitol-1-phosphate 5-dehydrogenase [Halobacillus sp. Nhm2S1]|uniref:mannitol-1-phosphate 5-dehydrogenase n=1 Tax=Halobacillus sp. Nhm2S1 TaxID=2866716 RepID=UPI001C7379BB|nr:mannitol-1-phosphate 5-dehydrogenase [Halobacillus sp. Nhm2S1]MBX0356818.1 mannitol-1-phosphate 5-dehydrogenase [Halobacillus sp. Nhm2S1]